MMEQFTGGSIEGFAQKANLSPAEVGELLNVIQTLHDKGMDNNEIDFLREILQFRTEVPEPIPNPNSKEGKDLCNKFLSIVAKHIPLLEGEEYLRPGFNEIIAAGSEDFTGEGQDSSAERFNKTFEENVTAGTVLNKFLKTSPLLNSEFLIVLMGSGHKYRDILASRSVASLSGLINYAEMVVHKMWQNM